MNASGNFAVTRKDSHHPIYRDLVRMRVTRPGRLNDKGHIDDDEECPNSLRRY